MRERAGRRAGISGRVRSSSRGLDLSVYLRGLGLLVRNPVVIIPPLLMAVISAALGMMAGSTAASDPLGGMTGGIVSFIEALLRFFGLGVAIIIGDQAWRRKRASFEDGWAEGRRKAGDIIFATIGLTFCIYIAGLAGQLLGIGIIGLALMAVVVFFLIYTIPAAAIGGVPGGAALQASLEAVRAAPLPALVLAIVSLGVFVGIEAFVSPQLSFAIAPYVSGALNPVLLLVNALLTSIGEGYIAIVVAKVYADTSFRPRW